MRATPFRSLKFVPPRTPPGFVWRPRLAQALALGLSRRLMVLEAPAGYGKTSLLASMAEEWGRFAGADATKRLAWYALDPTDDDAAAFVDGLVESIRRVVPDFGATTLAALRGTADARGRIDSLMGVLLDELRSSLQDDLVLVLDDFQWLSDKVILNALERLLLGPESPLRPIISTRSDLPFYLAVLRSKEQLVELGADDFRFTPEESRELILQRVGQRVPRGPIEEVIREMGGWPSATNLASLLMARCGGSLPSQRLAPTEHGYRMLVRELLARFPLREREDVARTSLLRFLDVESCREGAGISEPESILRRLEVEGLPATRFEGWNGILRYEPLFQSFLQQEASLLLLPRERRELLRRVSSYYAGLGAWDHALRGLLEADLAHEAAVLVEQAAETELAHGHLDTVLRWIHALPGRVRSAHPRLMVLEAELLQARGRLDDARPLLVAVRSELETTGDEAGSARRWIAWTALLLAEGRYQEARESAQRALERLPQEASAERAESLWLLARSLELTGDLAAAHSAAAEGLLMSERSGRWELVVRAMVQVARLDYLRGRFTESLALSGRAVQRSALLGLEVLYLSALGGIAASIYQERGRWRESAEVAQWSLDAGHKVRDDAGRVRSGLALALALERLGQPEAAQERLEEATALAEKLPSRALERVMALQAAAAALLRRDSRREAVEKAKLALRAAMQSSHQPLIDQCHLLLTAANMAGLGILPSTMRLRGLQDAFRRSDSQRWWSASLRLLAQGYMRLGIRRAAAWNLQSSLAVGSSEACVGMPLDLPSDGAGLLDLAVRSGTALDVAAARLGVSPEMGRKVLGPLLHHRDAALRARAEQASKGMETEAGRIAAPALLWPQLQCDAVTGSTPVAFRTLGEFRPLVGSQLVEWPSADARNLAAYLIVHRSRTVPRSRLLLDLWPGNSEAAANLRLHTALYQLREILGTGYPAVDLEAEGRGEYRWDGLGCFFDAELFQERIEVARQQLEPEKMPMLPDEAVSLLESALKVYGGEFLPELVFAWCGPWREELRAQLLWAARLLISHYMALHNWREAIGHGLKSLRSDPLQEDVVRDLMVCYFKIGDRNAVLQQYREIKRLLAKERGVWPSEETRRLRVKLLGK